MISRPALAALALVMGCDPYADWPEPTSVFPYVFTPEADLEPWAEVRWETETWDPGDDTASVGAYILKAQNHRKSAPVESLRHFDAMRDTLPPSGAGVRLDFVGDIMVLRENEATFALPVAALLDGDLRVGNLETPVAPSFSTDPEDLGLYEFNAPEETLDGLPLDALQLNNNHSMDVGEAGLEETVQTAQARGFVTTGVDAAALVDVGAERVALLAYTWGLNGKAPPASHDLHVVPFGHLDEAIDLAAVEADAAAARADGATAVVALVHWGFEYEYYPDPHFLVLGRRLVAAGVDVVVGSGPHTAQPAELCAVNRPEIVPGEGTCSLRTDDGVARDAAIFYSLGNFATRMATVELQSGLIGSVTLEGGVTGMGWRPIVTWDGPTGREVRALDDVTADSLPHAAELDRLTAHLGAGWRR